MAWRGVRSRRARLAHTRQHDAFDCGPACLKTVCDVLGVPTRRQAVQAMIGDDANGASLGAICRAAAGLGLFPSASRWPADALDQMDLPAIAHWRGGHFVVVLRVENGLVWVSDPARAGVVKLGVEDFVEAWAVDDARHGRHGIAVTFEVGDEVQDGPSDDRRAPAPPSPSSLTILRTVLAPHGRAGLHLLSGLVVGGALTSLGPLIYADLLRGIDRTGDRWATVLPIAAMLVLGVAATLLDVVRTTLAFHLGAKINFALVDRFLSRVLGLHGAFFARRTTGDILERFEDQKRIQRFVTERAVHVGFAVITLLGYLVVVGSLSPRAGGVLAAVLILQALWVAALYKRRVALDEARFEQMAKLRGSEVRIIDSIADLKVNNAEAWQRGRWRDLQQALYAVNIDSVRLQRLQQGVAHGLFVCGMALVSWVFVREAHAGHVASVATIAGLLAAAQLAPSFEELVQFAQEYQDCQLSMARARAIEDFPLEGDDRTSPPLTAAAVSLRSLSFTYPGAASPALAGLDLDVEAGRTLAVVGASGSGKSTLMRILTGLADGYAGSARLFGAEIRDAKPESLRARMGVVLQDGTLLGDTLRDNIVVAQPFELDHLEAVLDAVCLDDLVRRLPRGLETNVSAGGHALSGGERQRLLLARALYRRPAILLLDEATSALDTVTEARIVENLRTRFPDMLKVISAHRLSTIMAADAIVVLEDGHPAGVGTHEELLGASRPYSRLVHAQLSG